MSLVSTAMLIREENELNFFPFDSCYSILELKSVKVFYWDISLSVN